MKTIELTKIRKILKDSASLLSSAIKENSIVPKDDAKDGINLICTEDDFENDSISDSLEVELVEDNSENNKKNKIPNAEYLASKAS